MPETLLCFCFKHFKKKGPVYFALSNFQLFTVRQRYKIAFEIGT